MKQSEYVKTVIYNDRMINIGLDDYGQTYFIEYAEDGELKEECVGSYIEDYEDYIEYKFGDPEINCLIYNDVITTDTECCTVFDKLRRGRHLRKCFRCLPQIPRRDAFYLSSARRR